MNILLLGPQGSGKGTQARLLVQKYGLFYFETGGFLREMAKRFPVISDYQNKGVLVPDPEFTSYLTAFFDEKGQYDDILFDGFPRTIQQYQFLKKWLKDKEVKLDLVLVIEISDEEAVKRLSARRMDPSTGKIYNLVTEQIPVTVDKSGLVQRADDQPQAIKKRLSIYRTQTTNLINEMKKDTVVKEVNGERPVDQIHSDIVDIIGQNPL